MRSKTSDEGKKDDPALSPGAIYAIVGSSIGLTRLYMEDGSLHLRPRFSSWLESAIFNSSFPFLMFLSFTTCGILVWWEEYWPCLL